MWGRSLGALDKQINPRYTFIACAQFTARPGWFGQWQFLLSLPPLLPALLPAVVLPSDNNKNNNWGSCYPCRIFTTYHVCLCVCVCVKRMQSCSCHVAASFSWQLIYVRDVTSFWACERTSGGGAALLWHLLCVSPSSPPVRLLN